VLVAALIFLGGSEGAGAATLKASYRLQGNRVSEVAGAPELTDLGAGNRFAFETVDGISRQVLTFPRGNGLSLATTGLVDPDNHSVVMLFRLADVSGYRRILDFSNGTSDNGLYDLSGHVVLYVNGNVAASQGAVFDDSYVQLVLTNAAAPGGSQQTAAYINGVSVAAAKTSEDFDLGSGVLRFFKDNTSGPGKGEESAGAVSCILVYDGTLTAEEVGQVAGDPSLCPAPRPVPGRAKALATGKPQARRSGRSIVVDTGLTVSCPIGTASCAASGRVDVAPARGRATAARIKHLGAIGFSVPAGASRRVAVRLSGPGARALRRAGTLKVRASAEIAAAGGRRATAQQTGRIKAPRPPAFKAGTYTGTTGQGLPIFITVGQTAVRSVYFRWRVSCADGQTHTNTIFLRGGQVRRGRFSFGGVLDTGGSVQVSGRIKGVHASGTLSRMGASAFGTKCTTKKIRWHARASGVEVESSPR
jgi:concanavalin A-like lectin/glucanase superfamily protein